MIDKPGKVSLYGATARAYQDVGGVVPRPSIDNASGDSEAVKRYRRFFETHDLRGLPKAPSGGGGGTRAAPR
ncbi:MAG TPA: hypothetical protein VGD08_25800 [Stellaceae bacterium]|jgi:hypothetical protein